MSEPSSGVPSEIADSEVEDPQAPEQPERVELDLDEEKLEAWDDIKGDYQVDPDEPRSDDDQSEDDQSDDEG
jgi:hypothetical protein